ncbi:hypothetical protein CPC08DRAFT_714970, partial [Agrocybe pediades]
TSRGQFIAIRRCSQVCRHWRSIIVSSSSIWGRLIDLDLLTGQTTDDWMKEVVRRAGEALLWVYGEIGSYYNTQHRFLLTFLQDNWGRVELLVVDAHTSSNKTLALLEDQKATWSFLLKPAPRLRWFYFILRSYYYGYPSLGTESGPPLLTGPIFKDSAPLLTDFHISSPAYFTFSIQAPWIPNLCAVKFSTNFTMEEVLMALQRMPRLAELAVDIGPKTLIGWQGPDITLPRLRSLDLRGELCSAGTILQHITPSTDCGIAVVELEHPKTYIPDANYAEYAQYETALAKYVVPCLSQHLPSAVVFNINYITTALWDVRDSVSDGRRSFHVSLHTPFLSSSLLMKELGSCTYTSQIRELIVRTNGPPIFDQLGLISILTAFPSITTLSTVDVIIRSLLKDSSITATVLPVLTTLKISYQYVPKLRKEEEPHHRFLQFRRAIGRSLSVFEIIFIPSFGGTFYDMDYLEEHIGLVVKWGIEGEDTLSVGYRCGDGHPERLRFDIKSLLD